MNGWLFGVGMSLISLCVQWFWPAVPRAVAGAGIAVGVVIIVSEMLDKTQKFPISVFVLIALGIICFAAAAHLYTNRNQVLQSAPTPQPIPATAAQPPLISSLPPPYEFEVATQIDMWSQVETSVANKMANTLNQAYVLQQN